MGYEEDIKWLYGLKGSKLGLGRIKEACERFGNPQNGLKIIHIAGTNGKGSTSVMIQGILTAAGFKVGRFNSPHLIDFRERISIDDKWITKEELSLLIAKVKDCGVALTFFEFATTMAFLYFRDQDCDYVVLETGLGGRYDATNVSKNKISVITNIEFDHTVELGSTLEKIAYEKAGIIDSDSIVIYGGYRDLKNIFDKGKKFVFVDYSEPLGFKLGLVGEHQKKNAKVSIEAVRALEIDISERDIRNGLGKIKWPGRLETIGSFTLDVAHNPAGMKVLKEYFNNDADLTIVLGILKDKDYLKILQALPKHSKLILTKPSNDRALDPEVLGEYTAKSIIFNDVKSAIDYAKKESTGKILVTGSCYTVGEARNHIIDKYFFDVL